MNKLIGLLNGNYAVIDNIHYLRDEWLERGYSINNVELHIHPITYRKLLMETGRLNSICYYNGLVKKIENVLGIPVIKDNKVALSNLILKEREDNMEIKADKIILEDYCKNDIDSLDAMRYYTEGIRGAGKTAKVLNPLPKRYIVNQDACILFWNDDSKTIVKRAYDDMNDPVKGFLWAYFQKHSGLSKTKANEYLRKIAETDDKPRAVNVTIDGVSLKQFSKNIKKMLGGK